MTTLRQPTLNFNPIFLKHKEKKIKGEVIEALDGIPTKAPLSFLLLLLSKLEMRHFKRFFSFSAKERRQQDDPLRQKAHGFMLKLKRICSKELNEIKWKEKMGKGETELNGLKRGTSELQKKTITSRKLSARHSLVVTDDDERL